MKEKLLIATAGIIIGLIVSALFKPHRPVHVKAEYYLELRPNDRAIIESVDRQIYECHIDSIPSVLTKDNL
jgi:hypothetical protein